MPRYQSILLMALLSIVTAVPAQTQDPAWPAPVAGFVAPKPGEHPRLFFRTTDLAAMKARAQTPEGKMLMDRAILLLDGATAVREGKRYTLWDGAAYGFLYQMTGQAKYAELAKGSVDKAWAGANDKDDRYSLNPPGEPMRNGMAIAAMATAYDLCYTGWTPEYRKDQAQRIFNWSGQAKKKGGKVSLAQLAMNPLNPNPISNHFGMQIGGAGIAILALRGDTELDAEQQKKLDEYQKGVDKSMNKLFTYDFGEGGYFGEHPGPGVIAMTWTVLPYIKADRVAGGRDWVSNKKYPAAQWITLRFTMQTIPTDTCPMYPGINKGRGGYGGDIIEQNGGHHSTYFSQGFGAVEDKYKPAMLWVYQNFFEPLEVKQYKDDIPDGQKTFDVFNYPHRAMMAFVNWPWGVKPENPEKVMAKVREDKRFGQYIFRNRWKDRDDIEVAALFGARTADAGDRLIVWGLGQRLGFGQLKPSITGNGKVGVAAIDAFSAFVDGSGSVSGGGNTIGVDYSLASGADAVVVLTGPAATGKASGLTDAKKAKVQSVTVGSTTFSILTFSAKGQHPTPEVAGNTVRLAGQTFSLDGKLIKFAKSAEPLPKE